MRLLNKGFIQFRAPENKVSVPCTAKISLTPELAFA